MKSPKSKRRGHNEGSIYYVVGRGWVGAIPNGYKNGKLQRKYFSGVTRQEVSNKVTAALKDQQDGIPIITGRQTLGKFLDTWLEEIIKPRVRVTTYISYEQQVRVHIKPALGHLQLTKLAPQHILRFINNQLETDSLQQSKKKDAEIKKLSAKTAKYHLSILRMALKQAMKWNLVSRNVATLVDAPRVKKYEVQPINEQEAFSFLKAVEGDRFEAIFCVALALGLRRGEALGLKWSDVDFQNRVLKVNQGLQRIKGELVLHELKTDKSRRTLKIPKVLLAKLREHRTKQLEEKLKLGSDWTETDLVFTTGYGTPIDPRHVKRTLDRILKNAGIPHCRIHDLRHFFASLLLAQGVELKVVSELLGHNDIRITADIYAHVLPSLQREAIDLMDKVLTGGK